MKVDTGRPAGWGESIAKRDKCHYFPAGDMVSLCTRQVQPSGNRTAEGEFGGYKCPHCFEVLTKGGFAHVGRVATDAKQEAEEAGAKAGAGQTAKEDTGPEAQRAEEATGQDAQEADGLRASGPLLRSRALRRADPGRK